MTTRLALFQPTRLRAAALQVVELHPSTASRPAVVDESSLPALRRRLVRASGDTAALESLALELSPREVRSLITGLLLWEDLRPDVLALLGIRIRPAHLPMLWNAWQRLPQLSELVQLIGCVPADSWTFLAMPYAILAPRWIQSDDPGVVIQDWLDGLQMTHSDLPRLGGAAFMADTPIVRLVHEAVLTHGSAAQLRRETDQALLRPARELPMEGKRMLFGRNYLSRFTPFEWRMPVLEEIRNWYGLPRRARLPRFWEEVPEETRDAFQRLVIQRTLRRAFGDDDRSQYWLRWESALHDVHEGDTAGTRYVVMLFADFGVVEFFEVGNAAYFYDRAKAESFAGRRPHAPSELKELLHPRISFFGDNRLIHRQNWQPKADRMVAAYARRFGGR